MLALIVQKDGHTVTTAADAVEARRCLATGAYDLAFLDLALPDIDGLALLAEFRQQYPEMDVLIVTGHATLDDSGPARRVARD